MLQSGVGTRDLDVRWVSSLSWYFLTLFGLQPVYNFILGSDNCELCKFRTTCLFADTNTISISCEPNVSTDGTDEPWCGCDGSKQ
jgi:hypothetical protein